MDGDHVKGICTSYFENHVSPVLKYIQQAQEQINGQLQDLRLALELKANKAEVMPSLQQLEDAAKSPEKGPGDSCAANGSVSTQVRLKEISAAVQRKADLSAVASLVQFNKLVATVEQKANSKEVISAEHAALMKLALEERVKAVERQASEVVGRGELEQLGQQLQKRLEASEAEVKRVQVLLAAAGKGFERQLGEVRQQLRQQRRSSTASVDASGELPPSPRSLVSRAESVASSRGWPATASEGGWSNASGGEEVGKLRAVLGAAGSAFAKQLHEVREKLREQASQIQALQKGQLARSPSAVGL